MEVQLLYSLVFFVAILFILFIISRFQSSKSLDKCNNLPPQPWKLPLVGHLHHLLGGPPHQALGNLAAKLGPVVHLQLGEISSVVISSPTLAKEIMKTHDLSFADRPKLLSIDIVGYNCKDIAFSPYGDYWRQMRKICILELLSAKKVQSFRCVREEESWNLVEFISMQTSKTINLSDKILAMMNTVTCKVAVGSRCKDRAKLVALLEELIYLSSGFDVSDIFPSFKVLHVLAGTSRKLMKIRKKMDDIFCTIISEHEKHLTHGQGNRENEDIVDVLLRLQYDGGLQFPLTSENIKAIILDMFIAGTGTSSVTIEWAMSELMKNPRVMKKLQVELRQKLAGKKKIHESDIQELDYLKLVIMETLRLHPPLPLLLPRECRETCEIGGYNISVKTKVMINVWKIGRDPAYWIDPESFVPERFSESSVNMMGKDFEFLPFGAGRRMCPGIMMGLANLELSLVLLLYHFNWELPGGSISEDLDMSGSFGGTVTRKHPLLLVPSLYNSIK